MITINILKLLILIPFFLFMSIIIGGHYWYLAAIGLMVLSWFWYDGEQKKAKQKAHLAQQVEDTRQNMIKAQAEAERAQRKADIADAVRQGVEAAQEPKIPEHLKGQWN